MSGLLAFAIAHTQSSFVPQTKVCSQPVSACHSARNCADKPEGELRSVTPQMEQLVAAAPIEWLKEISFCLAYVAGMRAIACAAAICRGLPAAPTNLSNR